MTGFVDPAFQNIKLTEPHFFVWRMSKMALEVKPISKNIYGYLYDEDCYIVYSSSPIKKVPGSPGKGTDSKMEIHIHFWIGSKTSEEERKRTITKAVELDDVLEGNATVHREMEGFESNRFLSYFRTGLVIQKGEITSVLKGAVDQKSAKLFKLSERASTMILVELPSISWNFIDSRGVFILETKSRLFIWVGKEVPDTVKFFALKFQRKIKLIAENKKVVLVEDKKENNLTKEELQDFEDHLKLETKLVKSNYVGRDLQLIQTQTRKMVKLYKVDKKDGKTAIIYLKSGPLKQSDLDSMSINIVDHYKNKIWIWIGKKFPKNERSQAINLGITYLDIKTGFSYSEATKQSVAKVLESSEPEEFKFLFKIWQDNSSTNSDYYFSKKLRMPVNFTFTGNVMEDSPFLAAKTQLVDDGSGMMKILRLSGSHLTPLQPDDFGIFYSKFSYLVHYSYIADEKTKNILFYWLGTEAPDEEKKNNIWESVKKISGLNDASVIIRLEQNRETPQFCAIFQGKMLILKNDPPESSEKNGLLNSYPVLLLKVLGGDIFQSQSMEVEPRASSLNSYNVFILRAPKLSYIWCGDEREMAKNVANRWTREYRVIIEGREPKEFWKLLKGYANYFSEKIPALPSINVPPTLYKCYFYKEGFAFSKIINFTQSDLNSYEIFLLDAWETIFVWTGKDVPEENSQQNGVVVEAYLDNDPCHRERGIPIVHVYQEREPPTFRGFFPFWNKSEKLQIKEVNRNLFEKGSKTEEKGNPR